MFSQDRQHARQYLEPQVLFVAQSIRPTLDDADLVVESLDKAERDLVFRLAIGGDTIPMTIAHASDLLGKAFACQLYCNYQRPNTWREEKPPYQLLRELAQQISPKMLALAHVIMDTFLATRLEGAMLIRVAPRSRALG